MGKIAAGSIGFVFSIGLILIGGCLESGSGRNGISAPIGDGVYKEVVFEKSDYFTYRRDTVYYSVQKKLTFAADSIEISTFGVVYDMSHRNMDLFCPDFGGSGPDQKMCFIFNPESGQYDQKFISNDSIAYYYEKDSIDLSNYYRIGKVDSCLNEKYEYHLVGDDIYTSQVVPTYAYGCPFGINFDVGLPRKAPQPYRRVMDNDKDTLILKIPTGDQLEYYESE